MKHGIASLALILLGGCALSHVADIDGAAFTDAGTLTPPSYGIALPTCGPTDGPAWSFFFSDAPVDCSVFGHSALPPGATAVISVFDALEDGTSERAFRASTAGRDAGVIEVCSPECAFATGGTIVVERFLRGREAVLRWSGTLDDGTPVEGRGRIVTFCPRAVLCG